MKLNSYPSAQEVYLGKSSKIAEASRISPEDTAYPELGMTVTEMKINGLKNPDIAEINISRSTPIERYTGNGKVAFIFMHSEVNRGVGIIRESSSGVIDTMVWDPLTQGGPRGIKINGGDTFQILMTGPTTYYEYWTPKGFMSKREGELVGLQDLLFLAEGTEDENGASIPEDLQVSPEFIAQRDELLSYIEGENNERS